MGQKRGGVRGDYCSRHRGWRSPMAAESFCSSTGAGSIELWSQESPARSVDDGLDQKGTRGRAEAPSREKGNEDRRRGR